MPDLALTKSEPPSWRSAALTMLRLIFFRASRHELSALHWRHLVVGLLCTWLVGIGRYWDNPRVGLVQHLGIGSVIYILALSLFLWLIIWPLRPQSWTYFQVLTFISMVSPPAVLYAIPVEKFVTLEAANAINAWFLAIVASWRVALLIFYLRRAGDLERFPTFVGAFFPLTIIVVTLTTLNLDKVVFDIMGGGASRSPNDSAYAVLFLLSLLSVLLFIPFVICYLWLLFDRFISVKYHVEEDE